MRLGALRSEFNGVACASAIGVLRGWYSRDGFKKTVSLAERGDGTKWTILPLHNPTGANSAS